MTDDGSGRDSGSGVEVVGVAITGEVVIVDWISACGSGGMCSTGSLNETVAEVGGSVVAVALDPAGGDSTDRTGPNHDET